MHLLFDKKWENGVMSLELHRFYTIQCICLIYSLNDRPLCVLSFDTKNMHRYYYGKVTCCQSWVPKIIFFKSFLSLARISSSYKLLYYCKFTRSLVGDLAKCGLEFFFTKVYCSCGYEQPQDMTSSIYPRVNFE